MRTRALLFITMLSAIIISCGVAKKSTDSGPKVQTTFFGAKFGERGQRKVVSEMEKNIGYYMRRVDKTSWVARDVSFAKENWEGMSVYFEDDTFNRIAFSNRFSTKEEALEFEEKVKLFLMKKYPLKNSPFLSAFDNIYTYHDSMMNTVSVCLMNIKSIEDKPWTCSVVYSWYKSGSIAEEKAMNEI